MAEQATSESSPDTDRDFDPTAEMLIHDYDDEQTLDEEEAMSNGESVVNELVALQQESEMPMEQLLAMYGYGRDTNEPNEAGTLGSATNEANVNSEEETVGPSQPMETDGAHAESLENSDPDKSSSDHESVVPSQMAVLLTADPMEASTDEDEEDDEDYEPDNDENWKKNVQVGSDYQADVPEGQEPYGDAPVYEGEDRLLWDPKELTDSEIEKYLEQVQMHNFSTAQGVNAIPAGSHIRDDEQALYLLLNCEHNLDEALRRHQLQSVPTTSDPMSLWSEEECRNFELGLRAYGKDFFANQQNKVRTRSVKELVQFYYLWKKTERHDAFAARTRLEKKKYALHPGITDYMDRFLDEHENLAEPHDQMTSPNIRSLLYGDPKRQEGRSSEDFTAALEIVQKVANSSTVDFLLPGKFREDMQAVILGSVGTHSEPPPELSRFAFSELPTNSAPFVDVLQLNLPYRAHVAENAQMTLPVSMDPGVVLPSNENSDCLERVLEMEQSEGLPPFKRPRLQSPDPAELLLPDNQMGCFAAEPKETVLCSIASTSACLSPAMDSISLTSSAVCSTELGPSPAASVPALSSISEPNVGRFVSPECSVAGSVACAGAGSFDATASAEATSTISTSLPSASHSDVRLPFDSFPATPGTLCTALEVNLDSQDGVASLDDALAGDSMNPGLQRLTSLDSIEPSLPALDTSIDTYTSVLAGPGIALESIVMDSLTSLLDGFNPDTTTDCQPVDSSSGHVSVAASAVALDNCSDGNAAPTTTASGVVVGNHEEKSLTESCAPETVTLPTGINTDKGLVCSVASSCANTTIHSATSETVGSQSVESCDLFSTKGSPGERMPIGTGVNSKQDGELVSGSVETVVTDTTLTPAVSDEACASSEQFSSEETKCSFATDCGVHAEPISCAPASGEEPVSDTKPESDGEAGPGRKQVSDTSAPVDNVNNELDRLSGNQRSIVDVVVCEALVTEHGSSALFT